MSLACIPQALVCISGAYTSTSLTCVIAKTDLVTIVRHAFTMLTLAVQPRPIDTSLSFDVPIYRTSPRRAGCMHAIARTPHAPLE